MSGNKILYVAIIVILLISLVVGGCLSSGEVKGLGGEDFNMNDYDNVEISRIVSDPDQYTQTPVIVTGKIAQVCPTSGCWLMVTDGSNSLYIELFGFTVDIPNRTDIAVLGEVRNRDGQPYLAGRGIKKQ